MIEADQSHVLLSSNGMQIWCARETRGGACLSVCCINAEYDSHEMQPQNMTNDFIFVFN